MDSAGNKAGGEPLAARANEATRALNSASSASLRVGVVGCGYWGSKHVRVLSSLTGVEQVIAIEPRDHRRRELSKAFSGLPSFASLESSLDHVDALIIATPPSTHVPLALAAIAAGKHVLVEKPLSMSVAGAVQVIDEAAAQGVTLMVGHTFEYNAGVWKLREMVENDELGKLYYIDTARLNLGLYQSDVNVVWDLAPHDISITNYILRSRPSVVQTWASSHANEHVEDVAYIRLEYPDADVTANIHVSWLDPCKVRRVTLVGQSKMAVYNDLAAHDRVRIYDKGVIPPEATETLEGIPMSYRYGDITSPFIAFEEPLMVQDRHFIDCIFSGKQPLTDGENGLAVVEVLEAVGLSLRERRPVALEEVARPPTRVSSTPPRAAASG